MCFSVFPAGVQQLLVNKEEVSSERSPSLDQEYPKPIHIKEEQEEFWTNQEGEQRHGDEGADIHRFPFTAVIVKTEDHEEKPETSQLYQSQTEGNTEAEPPASSSTTQIKTETDDEDYGGCEPARNRDPGSNPQSNTDEKASDCSETDISSGDWQEPLSDSGSETQDSDIDWKRTRASESGVDAMKHEEVSAGDVGCHGGKKSCSCFECGKGFHNKGSLQSHTMCHLGKRATGFLVSKKCITVKGKVDSTQRSVNIGQKPFGSDVYGERFAEKESLKTHVTVHTGEKTFGCDVCGKRFKRQAHIETHMRVHTGEKPFGCGDCGTRFNLKQNLKRHMRVHTGEKPFGCDVCGNRFKLHAHLSRHMRVHTGEKPFGCDVCGNRFKQQAHLNRHIRVHTGEKPFGCDFCGKRFIEQGNLKKHMKVHSG